MIAVLIAVLALVLSISIPTIIFLSASLWLNRRELVKTKRELVSVNALLAEERSGWEIVNKNCQPLLKLLTPLTDEIVEPGEQIGLLEGAVRAIKLGRDKIAETATMWLELNAEFRRRGHESDLAYASLVKKYEGAKVELK